MLFSPLRIGPATRKHSFFALVFTLSVCGSHACTTARVENARVSTTDSAASAESSQPSDNANATTVASPLPSGPACGFSQQGNIVHIADNIDVCVPPTTCNPETCPASLGACQQGRCIGKQGYQGLKTLPEAWATYYCTLSTGGCDGISQIEKPAVTAQKLATQLSIPLCEGAQKTGPCVGIAASSPLMVGNSEIAVDPVNGARVRPWGLGLSEASNVCYQLAGPGGEAFVALTDRCGGYCKCNGSSFQECGACTNAPDLQPNCPCVGSAPGVADACCGAGCATVVPSCDWCATNNHPHFDLDQSTFNHVCGADAVRGSCRFTKVVPVACPLGVTWPPGG